VTLKLGEDDERVVVRLDDVIRLLEPDANLPHSVDNASLTRHRVVHRDGRVLARPLEVLERLPLVHVLLDIENDQVVEHLHFQRDPLCPLPPRPPEDELELDVLRRSTGSRVNGEGVFGVGEADGISTFGGGVDGEDADEDIDGFERVGEGVGEGSLFLTVLTPGRRFSIRREDIDEEGGEGGGEAAKEEEGEEYGEGLSGEPRLAKEGGDEGRKGGFVSTGAGEGGRTEEGRRTAFGGRDAVFSSSFGATSPPSRFPGFPS
jgi:hypothetical protein